MVNSRRIKQDERGTYCTEELGFLDLTEGLSDGIADLDSRGFHLVGSLLELGVILEDRRDLSREGKESRRVKSCHANQTTRRLSPGPLPPSVDRAGSRKTRIPSKTKELTRARSYMSLAFFMLSESCIFPTSPWSCLTFSCSSRFFSISILSVSTNTRNGDLGASCSRRGRVEEKGRDGVRRVT